ncbi:MAG: hypothetical protein GWN17_11545, partial [Candidatus Korarchaeota archaeon]|nr:hypothetical protein [Candidatus Thorarchaeota archaeon]NIW52830.1 hypothetical protein [Candidatus Korarchaeota archaeon]
VEHGEVSGFEDIGSNRRGDLVCVELEGLKANGYFAHPVGTSIVLSWSWNIKWISIGNFIYASCHPEKNINVDACKGEKK